MTAIEELLEAALADRSRAVTSRPAAVDTGTAAASPPVELVRPRGRATPRRARWAWALSATAIGAAAAVAGALVVSSTGPSGGSGRVPAAAGSGPAGPRIAHALIGQVAPAHTPLDPARAFGLKPGQFLRVTVQGSSTAAAGSTPVAAHARYTVWIPASGGAAWPVSATLGPVREDVPDCGIAMADPLGAAHQQAGAASCLLTGSFGHNIDDLPARSSADLRRACGAAALTDCLEQIARRIQFASAPTSRAAMRLLDGAPGFVTVHDVDNGAGQRGTAIEAGAQALIFDPRSGLLIGARWTVGATPYAVSVTRTVVDHAG